MSKTKTPTETEVPQGADVELAVAQMRDEIMLEIQQLRKDIADLKPQKGDVPDDISGQLQLIIDGLLRTGAIKRKSLLAQQMRELKKKEG